jgi:hypothetical protein
VAAFAGRWGALLQVVKQIEKDLLDLLAFRSVSTFQLAHYFLHPLLYFPLFMAQKLTCSLSSILR